MALVKARVQDDDVKAQGNETCTGFVVVVLKWWRVQDSIMRKTLEKTYGKTKQKKTKKQGRRERTSEVQGERCKEEDQETRTYKIPEKRKFREKQV